MNKEKTILLVDDFESIIRFMQMVFKSEKYNVLTAESGEKALEIVENAEVDLIISDYNMPEMNGLELLDKVKSNPNLNHIPFILLTTETDINKIQKAKDKGLTAWVNKPYNHAIFFDQVKHILSQEPQLQQA